MSGLTTVLSKSQPSAMVHSGPVQIERGRARLVACLDHLCG